MKMGGAVSLPFLHQKVQRQGQHGVVFILRAIPGHQQ